MSSIAENLIQVRQQIKSSLEKTDRESSSVMLLAVSKTRPAEDLRQAYAEGQRDFGENYLQESLEKITALQDLDISWHFIGPLQSNKTKAVAENFNWMHTVDRLKIAQRLSDQRPSNLPPLNICVQVNISQEQSKSGVLPSELPELIAKISELPNICVRGLMAIPKATENQKEQQQAFARMQTLLTLLQETHPEMDTLSMGMSGDMDAAIAEGSTIVRIGTAIFGARPAKD
ncbi:YggS family pyridoxal phosphate-dependent enzyme [Neptuniibacter sp.]|uniref:YggS family pyridoxal phosphate-dependent enzyme n=1 Tax=Neptuniibacter sp. TaxID=1962643 RepID=UPI002608F65D|nr:YggS family pyridoxal phosphate-dependent enzyme [Neptuniibacter sp.]MCP4595194.1 YggS family pyridoxal phosphate-dependent enzyme [Neptuniibacter sp.]